jgi:ribosomal protein S27AE
MENGLQSQDLEAIFSSPEVKQRLLELEIWLKKYSIYWRDELVGLITHVELLLYNTLRLADKNGVDKARVAEILTGRIRELLLSYNIQPEDITGYEPKGVRKDVAAVLSQIFPNIKNPYQGHAGKIPTRLTEKSYREPSIYELFYPVQNGDFSSVRELIDKGVDVNVTDTNGWAFIHYATLKGLTKIIQILVEKGADPNKRTREGWTPLHLAVAYDKYDVAMLLLQKGADPNLQDSKGKTPLHWAIENNKSELAKLLIECGALLDVPDREGKTPLDYAQDKSLKNILMHQETEGGEEQQYYNNICPVCGNKLVFIKALNRYYCFKCKDYRRQM